MSKDENGFETIPYTGPYKRPPRNEYGLSDHEEAFVAAYIENILEEEPALIAYKAVHPFSGLKDREKMLLQARAFASRFRIRHRIDQLVGGRTADAIGTLEAHVQRLAMLREKALDAGDVRAAIKAEELIGRANKHYLEVKLPETPGRSDKSPQTPEELKKEIEERTRRLGLNVVQLKK